MARAQAGSIVRRTMRTGEIQQGMIIAMASLIESRDGSTGEHIRRAEKYMEILAEAVQREGYHRETVTDDYVDALCRAAYIHDIGKLCVSDAILQKQGGLTDEEFEQMKYHTTAGGEMIRSAMGDISDEDYVSLAFDVATYHHERWDGSGYPKGLAGESIPLSARIMAVVDVFDVLSTSRCYKQAIPLQQTFEIMGELAGEQFDPALAQIFLRHKDEFAGLARGFGCAGGNEDE
jgi:response regulator RpfG family c-di-GMP phosphodiesterase